jgi:hypothetical protein
MILTVEEKTTATLRIEVPEQYAKAALRKEAGQVDRSSGFANSTLNIIYCNFFQKLNLVTKQ